MPTYLTIKTENSGTQENLYFDSIFLNYNYKNQNNITTVLSGLLSLCVVLVPTMHIPSSITAVHGNSGYLIFLLLANKNRYANELFNNAQFSDKHDRPHG